MSNEKFQISLTPDDNEFQRCVRDDNGRAAMIRAFSNGDSIGLEIIDYKKYPPKYEIPILFLGSEFEFIGLKWTIAFFKDVTEDITVECNEDVPLRLTKRG